MVEGEERGSEGPSEPIGYHYLRRLCRDRGILFEDPEFGLPPRLKPRTHAVTWMRPYEMCARPRFLSECASRFDVEAGEFGASGLVCAVSCLTLTPRLLERVVPPDQGFGTGAYCGIFRFRFWRFGEWLEVVVDDRLPTCRGRALFLRSASDPAEFWPALLEKAYAKLYGGYGRPEEGGGGASLALQDLTGGIAQHFRIREHEPHVMFQTVNSAVGRSTLVAATLHTDQRGAVRLRNGLVSRQAYSVTGMARVRTRLGEVALVRLRNPWGKGEWNGPWSDRSWEWDSLPDRDRELLGVRVRNDGEFWMSFDDFVRHFTFLDLLHVGPDDWMLEPALHSKRPWRAVLARRRWRVGFNAGGGPHCTETTAMNPQFRLHIAKNGAKKCHVVVSVLQQYCPGVDAPPLLPLGFAVYEVGGGVGGRVDSRFVASHPALDVAEGRGRETALFFTLAPGDFAVLPFTRRPDCEARFLLRIYTDELSSIWEVNEENVLCRDLSFAYGADLVALQNELPVLAKLMSKVPAEMDAVGLQRILRACWKPLNVLCEKPSLDLCRHLIMLRDPTITGRMGRSDLPGLVSTLRLWRAAFTKHDPHYRGRTSSFHLRSLLWEAGLTVSNKVLECCVLRFAKSGVLASEAFLVALVKLHLAHERFTSVEKKMRENAMSLEEMILLTVYS